jgi:AraC-like DNA-binding protein
MDKSVIEFEHTVSLLFNWQQDLVQRLGGEIIENKHISFANDIADGSAYFLDLSPDISVNIFDIVLKKSIRLVRKPSEEDFWIIYFDMSDSLNNHTISNVEYKIGYKSKLGFAVIDSNLKSSYLSQVGERAFVLRLLVSKSYVKNSVDKISLEKEFTDIFSDKKRKMFYYGHIDSRSKIILHDLKKQSMGSANYELTLKYSSYKLFGYFLERLKSNILSNGMFLEKDLNAIMKSQEYLLSDLFRSLPSLKVLSEIANMSVSKYRQLYISVFGMTPAIFFRNEKLKFAKKLLMSGDFKLISDVAFELGYKKTSYFSIVYKNFHGELPSTVFKRKLH